MLLVTGITGHSGSYFLEELIKNNYKGEIRCIVRETSNTKMIDNSELNIEKVVGDINDREFINSVMVGVDTIMHIYNIHNSPTIVDIAIKNNVERAILVHTTGIYSNFKYASQEYKDIEKEVSEIVSNSNSSIKVTILRPTMIYGDLCDANMSKFIKMVDNLRVMPVIDGGNSLIQPVNARDLGEAFYKVLVTPKVTSGQAYDLSGKEPIKMIEVFKLMSQELDKKRTFISVPLGIGVFMAKVLKVLTFSKIDYIERVERMAEDRSYSHENATKDFEYDPMRFKDGITMEVSQYLSKKKHNY